MSEPLQLPAGVHVLERGWLSSNNVVFTTGATAVVDTGYWTHSAQTVSLVDGLIGARGLDMVLSTHLHSDHCGGNAALARQYPKTKVLIPPGHSQHVQEWDPHALTYEPTGQHCPPFKFQGLLDDGMELQLGDYQWQVHSAPGHDPHSVILFQPERRILVSADALWENGFGVVFPELEGQHAFAAVSSTLDLIERLSPQVIVPGHGRVFTDLQSALGRARKRLDGFMHNPAKHAHHAAKVLLKFKLLEVQQMTLDELRSWASSTLYLRLVHERHFHGQHPTEWVQHLIDDLVRVGAAARVGQNVLNH